MACTYTQRQKDVAELGETAGTPQRTRGIGCVRWNLSWSSVWKFDTKFGTYTDITEHFW